VCDVELQFEKAMMNEVKNVKKRERECEKKKWKPTTLKLFMILRFTEWCDGTFPSRMHFLEQKN